MRNRAVAAAPNYTNAAMVMAFINLTWVFGVIWVLFGLPTVLVLAYGLNYLISRLAVSRGAQRHSHMDQPTPPH